jgi:hypothetical protein
MPVMFSLTKKTLMGFGPMKVPPQPAEAPQADRSPPLPPVQPIPPPIPAALEALRLSESATPFPPRASPDDTLETGPPLPERRPSSQPVVEDLPKVIVEPTPASLMPPTTRVRRQDMQTQKLPRIADDALPPAGRGRFAVGIFLGLMVLGGGAFGARLLFAHRAVSAVSPLSSTIVSSASAGDGIGTAPLESAAVSGDKGAVSSPEVPKPSAARPDVAGVAETPSASPAPSAIVAKRFRRAAAIAALDKAATDIGECRPMGSLWGPGSIRAAFSNDGSVTRLMLGPPYVGTQEGSCVAAHFRTAQMQPYGGTAGAVNYTFNIAK